MGRALLLPQRRYSWVYKGSLQFPRFIPRIRKIGSRDPGVVSKDSVKSHKKFADKYNLNFPLLSDESLDTIKAYGAWGNKKFMGREYDGIFRTTYVINPQSMIAKIYEKVNPLVHVGEIIADLKHLSG